MTQPIWSRPFPLAIQKDLHPTNLKAPLALKTPSGTAPMTAAQLRD